MKWADATPEYKAAYEAWLCAWNACAALKKKYQPNPAPLVPSGLLWKRGAALPSPT